jgi:hypothetical protein|tara:strand:- start:296 stop:502 length:207 start_codon:yes stop_codon:yes gene_type:complete
MKLTKSQLKQIILEELQKALQEDDSDQLAGEGGSWREAGIDKCMKEAERAGKQKTKEQCAAEYDKAHS